MEPSTRRATLLSSSSGVRERRPLDASVTWVPSEGDTLGRYKLGRTIGAGAMGTVFEAEHSVLQKPVAIKVLHPEIAAQAGMREHFVREGLAASRVRHAHVVDVTDAAEEAGTAYLVMELLEGESLDEALHAHGPYDVETMLDLMLPICAALAEAHATGVVHRDVKPENVFLVSVPGARPFPKLVDFGISDLLDETRDAGVFAGTPHYMAPEQMRGGLADRFTDQYAMGVMMFELLTGRLPYEASSLDNLGMLIGAIESGRRESLAEARPDAPELLVSCIERMMQNDPIARFPTMDRVGRALMQLASPRSQARYRDLVDPGWSRCMMAVTDSQPPPAEASETEASMPSARWSDHGPTPISSGPQPERDTHVLPIVKDAPRVSPIAAPASDMGRTVILMLSGAALFGVGQTLLSLLLS